MQLLDANPAISTADYRRQARRIRASFAGDTFLRQRALGELAIRRNAETQTAVEHTETNVRQSILSVIERGFSEHAATRLQSFGFTFSDRVRLLDSAERLGLSRFRANLLLAMLEHQSPGRMYAAPSVPGRSIAPSLLVILSIEIVVVGVLVVLCGL